MNLLFRDPHRYKATTFDEAVVKLEKLMEISGPLDWAKNMESVSLDLKPEYHDKFIRYLANPTGIETDFTICKNMEKTTQNELKIEHPHIDMDQLQTYSVTKREGNTTYILCEPAVSNDDDDEKIPQNQNLIDEDDEKIPDKVFTV